MLLENFADRDVWEGILEENDAAGLETRGKIFKGV